MSRYVTRIRPAHAFVESYPDDQALLPELSVDGPNEVNTGLVSETGEPIYRVPPPIGFGRDDEW